MCAWQLNRTGVADSGVVDFYPHFVRLWRGDFDLFDGQIFPGLPRHGGLCVVSLFAGEAVESGPLLTLHVIVC